MTSAADPQMFTHKKLHIFITMQPS